MKQKLYLLGIIPIIVLLFWGAVSTNINDFFLAGSQPGQSGNLESPDKCDNCHGGYDLTVEPAYNWRGSMMAQAARDPLFEACLAIANQDAPESGDLCIRCHAPDGWLNGRSEPTDGSALNNNDREGVQCDFCHKLVKPSPLGTNPFPENSEYTNGTYQNDQGYLALLSHIPPQSGNGMYIVDSDNAKRGPFVDAAARHQMMYSPFHSEADICATCHDVSNPVYNKTSDNTYEPDALGKARTDFNTYGMLPVERTFSEWKMSAYNSPEGIESTMGGNKAQVSTCQDCHMKDVSGYGCNKKGVPFRNDLPLHDMTGGNTFIPDLVAQLHPEEVNHAALEAGKARALAMLQQAASMNLEVLPNENGFIASVEVINETGHKLPSGYPEGRRIWVNLKAFDVDGNLIYESGAYDENTATLTKEGTKIYEIKLGLSDQVASIASADGQKTYSPGESFHFVLNDIVVKDNRIPPRGFTNANFNAIQSPVVNYSYQDGEYWDKTSYLLPEETFAVHASLMYQTISKEYAEFLKNENRTNEAGNLFYHLWETNGKSKPVVMNEAIFYNGTPPVKYLSVVNSSTNRLTAKGGKTYLQLSFQIIDNNNNGIANAQINGSFSGPTSESVSAISDANGWVSINSNSTKRATDLWCFTINSVNAGEFQLLEPVYICESLQKSGKMDYSNNEEQMEQVFYAYPNPGQGDINVKFYLNSSENVTLSLYSMDGKLIKIITKQAYEKGMNELQENVSDLSRGNYLLELRYGDRVNTSILKIQ